MMTMKEACNYAIQNRRERAEQHRLRVLDRPCSGLTEKEYLKEYKVKQKGSYMKGKGFASKGLWNHYNISTRA